MWIAKDGKRLNRFNTGLPATIQNENRTKKDMGIHV